MSKVLELIQHPYELKASVEYKYFSKAISKRNPKTESENLRTCYQFLDDTSRSFSRVIQELRTPLREAVAVYYLILRALDTVEDDMSIPIDKKDPVLRSFYTKLNQSGWTYHGCSEEAADRHVLERFDVIIKQFLTLEPLVQEVITASTKKMGNGMADYAGNEDHINNGIQTVKEFDLYCHYVAGLVGDGLTRLFVASKLENEKLLKYPELANGMGLFLQKINIIRDFREDLDDNRQFWPHEIWSHHTKDLHDLTFPENEEAALNCISAMALNALQHARQSLEYLSMIKDPSVFKFCAIPQVMAIATLSHVFRNPDMLHKNIKIRRGETCLLITQIDGLKSVCDIFVHYVQQIHAQNTPSDPNFMAISVACGKIEQWVVTKHPIKYKETFKVEQLAHRETQMEVIKIGAVVVLFWIVMIGILTGIVSFIYLE